MCFGKGSELGWGLGRQKGRLEKRKVMVRCRDVGGPSLMWNFAFSWPSEKQVNHSFGTCQGKRIFPLYHPLTLMGHTFLPIRGAPHRGPGYNIMEDVSIYLPLGRSHFSNYLQETGFYARKKCDLGSIGTPWSPVASCKSWCQILKLLPFYELIKYKS